MVTRLDTKELLAESLIELSNHKPLDKITVKEIAENCALKRETFYYYFSGKTEFIQWVYKKKVSDIISKTGYEPLSITIKKLYKFMSEHKQIFKKTLLSLYPMDNFHNILVQDKIENLTNHIKSISGKTVLTEEEQFAIYVRAHASVGIIEEWLRGRITGDIDKISVMFAECMPDLLKKYFAQENDLDDFK